MRSRALALSTTLALVLLPSQLPAAALPLMRTEWQASAAELGWVVSAYLLGYAIAVLVVLPLTDRVRPSRVIAIGALVTTLANLAFAVVAHDVLTASFLRVVAGFGLAGVYMPGVRIVAQTSDPARRGTAVGLYVAAFYLGSSLSFLATGLLLPFGWRAAALALGVIALVALPTAIASTTGIAHAASERAHLDLRVLRNAPLVRTIAAYTGHSWELFIVRAWLAAFLAAAFSLRGLSPTDASATASQWAAILLALGVPGVFIGGWASDRIGRARSALLYAIGSGAISIGFGLLLDVPWPALVVVGAIYGALVAADSAVYSTAVTELAPASRVGSAQAIQAVAGFGIGSIGPVVAGATLDLGAGWIGPFVVAGVVGIAMALPLAFDSKLTLSTRSRSPQTREVQTALVALEDFLQQHEVKYAQAIAPIRRRVDQVTSEYLPGRLASEVRDLFGGMGSLTDVYITRSNGHIVDDEGLANEQLRLLTDDLWRLVERSAVTS